jgi:hypothetical protein
MLAFGKGPNEMTEMTFDSCLPQFQRINELAVQYLDLAEQGSIFFIKPMLLQVLYFCATKCRDWHTCWETMRLLGKSRRQESFWESAHVTAVVEQVIEKEYAGLTPDDVVPREARFDMMHASLLNQDKVHLWYHRPCDTDTNVSGTWTHISLH